MSAADQNRSSGSGSVARRSSRPNDSGSGSTSGSACFMTEALPRKSKDRTASVRPTV